MKRVIRYPNGVNHISHSNRTQEIHYPDGIIRYFYPNGRQEIHYAQGTIRKYLKRGYKLTLYPCGTEVLWNGNHGGTYTEYTHPDGRTRVINKSSDSDSGAENDCEGWPEIAECVECGKLLPHGRANHHCTIPILLDEGYSSRDWSWFN